MLYLSGQHVVFPVFKIKYVFAGRLRAGCGKPATNQIRAWRDARMIRDKTISVCQHSPFIRHIAPFPPTDLASDWRIVLRGKGVLFEAGKVKRFLREDVLICVVPTWALFFAHPVLELLPVARTPMFLNVVVKNGANCFIFFLIVVVRKANLTHPFRIHGQGREKLSKFGRQLAGRAVIRSPVASTNDAMNYPALI